MKRVNFFISACLIVVACMMISSCAQMKRKQIEKEMESFKKQLPMYINGTDNKVVDINLDGDFVVYTAIVTGELEDVIKSNDKLLASDKEIASVLSSFGESAVKMYIEAQLGVKYIYKSAETGKVVKEAEVSPEKLKEVSEKLKNGEIKANTAIDRMQEELNKMEFPIQVEEGILLTNAYIEGNDVYYVSKIEAEFDAKDFQQYLPDLKKDLIEGLSEDQLIMINKEGLEKENIHFVYVYKDSRDIEIARVNISPVDIFRPVN